MTSYLELGKGFQKRWQHLKKKPTKVTMPIAKKTKDPLAERRLSKKKDEFLKHEGEDVEKFMSTLSDIRSDIASLKEDIKEFLMKGRSGSDGNDIFDNDMDLERSPSPEPGEKGRDVKSIEDRKEINEKIKKDERLRQEFVFNYEEGIKNLNRGCYKEARKHLEAALGIDPRNHLAQKYLIEAISADITHKIRWEIVAERLEGIKNKPSHINVNS